MAGIGQALQENPEFPYILVRNEQSGVHLACGYTKMKNRLQTFACTSSIGPGATNMVTGAPLATINRLPVLLLPGDIFARRNVAPVLQQLESPSTQDISVNDAFKPVSRYWDRIYRPEQLITSLPEVMRVLTSPTDTGAVTLALPQDIQAEAFDFLEELLTHRVWHIPRLNPDQFLFSQAVEAIRSSKRPMIIAGGGVLYSEATEALAQFVSQTGLPVGETQAGKGSLPMLQAQNNTPDNDMYFNAEGVQSAKPLYFFLERYMESFIAEQKAFVQSIQEDTSPPVGGRDRSSRPARSVDADGRASALRPAAAAAPHGPARLPQVRRDVPRRLAPAEAHGEIRQGFLQFGVAAAFFAIVPPEALRHFSCFSLGMTQRRSFQGK